MPGKGVIGLNQKKRLLTESDIRIIESHSKKNLSDIVNEPDNAGTGYENESGRPAKPPV
jgi:hypothetical protein